MFLAAFLALALTEDPADKLINDMLRAQHVPGAWVFVIKDGNVVKRAGYGMANLELKVPVKPETMMQTGSIGKMLTAEGILCLVQDGKLKLDDSLASFFPNGPDWWKPITIRHLLSHTGGVPEYEGDKYSIDLKKEYTEAELVDFVAKMTPDFKPGEKWQYSNTDYMLLGVIIHKLTGKFYADFLTERVFKPAGMKTIRTNSDTDLIPNRAQGYDTVKGKWQNQDWVSKTANSTADGTLMCSADDFIAWDRALDGYKILPKPLQDLVWQEQKLNSGAGSHYGLGWAISHFPNKHPIDVHGGAWQGFISIYARFPQDHVSLAIFANGSNASLDKVAGQLAKLYLAK